MVLTEYNAEYEAEGLPSITGVDLTHMLEGDKPYMCRSPNYGLSCYLRDNQYDEFIKAFSQEIRATGRVDVDNINIFCEGQCPKGCQKKFNLKLGKSLTKKSFDKIYKHGVKYPKHCFIVKYEGNVLRKPPQWDDE
jgi:hypothetical protein